MTGSEIIASRRKAFGKAIQQQRKRVGLSQEKLALAADVDRSYMGRIERGEQSVSFDKIWSICDELEIAPSALFESAEIV